MGAVSFRSRDRGSVCLRVNRISAETHHAGSALAYEEAVKLSSELMKSLDRPATCEQHRHLLMLLETARNHLPGAVGDDFSRPSHPAYPEQDNHNDRIVATLEAAYQKAIMKLDASQEGLNWYDKLWKAARKVLERRTDIDDLSRTLHGRMEVALTGRPILDEPISLSNDHTSWLMMLPSHLEKIEGSIQKSFESVQFSTVAIMQYRQVLRAGPDPWKSDHNMGGQSCELADEVESLSDELLEAAQRALIPSRFAKQDGEILPIVQGVMRSADNISRSCMAIQQELSAAVDNSAWRVESEVQGDPSVLEDLRNLQTRIREQMVLPMSALDEVLRRYQRDLPILREHLSLELAEAMNQQTSLIGLADLLQRVRDQAAFVRTIEVEAIRLQSKIEVTQAQISHTRQVRDQRKDEAEVQHHKTPESLIQQVEKFASEAAMWESELAGRVPFVAAGSSASSFHHQHSPYDPDEAQTAAIQIAAPLLPASVSIAEPPLTPPSSPSMSSEALDTAMQEPPDSSSLLDLTNLDQKVRAHVNDLASRVAAAISHCQSSASTLKGTPVVPMISHDDVFGPLVASHLPGPNRHSASDATSRTDGPANRIRELHQQLDALQIDSVVQLSVPALYSSPLLRRLPTQQEAQLIQTEFLSLSARFTELVTTDNHPAYGEHYALQSALTNVKILLPQLVLLGSFSDTVKACDTVLSSLPEAIDAGESADVRRAIDAASTAMDRVEVTAEPVEADCRVTAEVKRILAAWDGLQGMMEGKVRPDHSHLSQETDEVASGSSRPAVSAFKFLPQPPSVHPGRAGSRSTSNPTATASKYLTATVSSRNRSASDTPTRSRRIVSRLVEVPGSSIEAVGNGVNLPMTSPAKQIPSSIALSAGMVARATATTPRTRKSSRHMPILKYFAIPKSTLDVAVGGIINKLHVSVYYPRAPPC